MTFPSFRKGHRDRPYIAAQILSLAKEGVKKTKIMYRCNLSFTQLNDYLKLLVNKPVKMLDIIGEGKERIYKTNPKGLEYLELYGQLTSLTGRGQVEIPPEFVEVSVPQEKTV